MTNKFYLLNVFDDQREGDGFVSGKRERRLLRNRITGGAVKKPAEYGIWKEKAGGAG